MNIPCINLHYFYTLHCKCGIDKRALSVYNSLHKFIGFCEKEEQIMMMRATRNACTVTRPANTVEAVISFAFINAARFFSALRFYFCGFYFTKESPI